MAWYPLGRGLVQRLLFAREVYHGRPVMVQIHTKQFCTNRIAPIGFQNGNYRVCDGMIHSHLERFCAKLNRFISIQNWKLPNGFGPNS